MSAKTTTDSSNDVLTQVLHPNDIRILRKHLMVGEKGDGTVSKKDQRKKQMTTNELRDTILPSIPKWTLREICITIVAFIAGESVTFMRKLHIGCTLYNCHQPLSTYYSISASLAVYVTCTIPVIDMYPFDFFLYRFFKFFSFVIPVYSAFQEQKLTDARGITKLMIYYYVQCLID